KCLLHPVAPVAPPRCHTLLLQPCCSVLLLHPVYKSTKSRSSALCQVPQGLKPVDARALNAGINACSTPLPHPTATTCRSVLLLHPVYKSTKSRSSALCQVPQG